MVLLFFSVFLSFHSKLFETLTSLDDSTHRHLENLVERRYWTGDFLESDLLGKTQDGESNNINDSGNHKRSIRYTPPFRERVTNN